MRSPTIMIAGGHGPLRERVTRMFDETDVIPVPIEDFRRAGTLIKRHGPALALCIASDRSPDKDLEMMAAVGRIDRTLPVIVVTARGSESLAVAALRAGANDYFKTPFADGDLLSSCRRWMRDRPPPHLESVKSDHGPPAIATPMVGGSRTMRNIKAYIQRVAGTDSTVLITGETGTGKELAAELIHQQSRRKPNPLIRVNCSAMPEGLVESELFGYERGAFTGAVANRMGKFEMAGGGSLFLDEIGEMRPYAQAKILHCIESKTIYPLGAKAAVPINSRIIAATNQDPETLIADGKFRADLYYRLNVGRIHLPPLRERRDDIQELMAFGIQKLNRKFNRNVQGLKTDVVNLLLRYDWPGNVRELMNVLEGAFINMPERKIKLADLPVYFRKKLTESQDLPSEERKRILAALLDTNWNKSTAAAKLKWSRMTLYRKMTKYHIVENRQPLR